MVNLPDAVRAKLQATNFWHLATINPDGWPQVSTMWVDIEGDDIILNTAIGRRKEKNLRRDPRLTISTHDKENAYENVEIRGKVVEFIEGDAAIDSINKLAKKYIGKDEYPWLTPDERARRFVPTFQVGRAIRGTARCRVADSVRARLPCAVP